MSKNPRLSNPSALPRGGSSRIVNKGQVSYQMITLFPICKLMKPTNTFKSKVQ